MRKHAGAERQNDGAERNGKGFADDAQQQILPLKGAGDTNQQIDGKDDTDRKHCNAASGFGIPPQGVLGSEEMR